MRIWIRTQVHFNHKMYVLSKLNAGALSAYFECTIFTLQSSNQQHENWVKHRSINNRIWMRIQVWFGPKMCVLSTNLMQERCRLILDAQYLPWSPQIGNMKIESNNDPSTQNACGLSIYLLDNFKDLEFRLLFLCLMIKYRF